MCILAGDSNVIPGDPLHSSDDANGLALALQYRSLFNMGLEVGADGMITAAFLSGIADPLEFLAYHFALAIHSAECELKIDGTRERRRARHRGRETRTFLVSPHGYFDGGLGIYVVVIEGADHFQPR